MTQKHTPAPWIFNSMGCFIQVALKESASPYDKVEAICSIHKLPDYKANARLIAAAPELYKMLKEAIKLASDENGEIFNGNMQARETALLQWKHEAKAAIAKAEGKY